MAQYLSDGNKLIYRGEVELGLSISDAEPCRTDTEMYKIANKKREYAHGPRFVYAEYGHSSMRSIPGLGAPFGSAEEDFEELLALFTDCVSLSSGKENAGNGRKHSETSHSEPGIRCMHSANELLREAYRGGQRFAVLLPRHMPGCGSSWALSYQHFIFSDHGTADYERLFILADGTAECRIAMKVLDGLYKDCSIHVIRRRLAPGAKTKIVYLSRNPDDYLLWAYEKLCLMEHSVLVYAGSRRDMEELLRMLLRRGGIACYSCIAGEVKRVVIDDSIDSLNKGDNFKHEIRKHEYKRCRLDSEAHCEGGRRVAVIYRDSDAEAVRRILGIERAIDCGVCSIAHRSCMRMQPITKDQAHRRALGCSVVYRMYTKHMHDCEMEAMLPDELHRDAAMHALLLLRWGLGPSTENGSWLRLCRLGLAEDGECRITVRGMAVLDLHAGFGIGTRCRAGHWQYESTELAALAVAATEDGCLADAMACIPALRIFKDGLRGVCAPRMRREWKDTLARVLYYKVAMLVSDGYCLLSEHRILRIRASERPGYIVVIREWNGVAEEYVGISHLAVKQASEREGSNIVKPKINTKDKSARSSKDFVLKRKALSDLFERIDDL